jgi:hypothetical protein
MQKGLFMKSRFAWASALALAVLVIPQTETKAAYTNLDGIIITNGVIVMTTRSGQDAFWRQQSSSGLWDADDNRDPGDFTPGDAAMAELLQDNGYTTRMVPEKVLSYTSQFGGPTLDWLGNPIDPLQYYNGGILPTGGSGGASSNVLYSAMLVIVSGSGSSADMPPPNTNRIPIIMGEHSCFGDNTTSPPRDHSEIFLYGNKNSGNLTLGNNPGLYMTVVDPTHPIMQGIPLDEQGRVKIYRDPYPEENLHSATSSKPNYEIAWTYVDCGEGKSVPAGGLTILGRLSSNTNYVVFAVMEAGGALADTGDSASAWFGYTTAPSRLVQLFNNEGGSGNTRRGFNCLTDIGRVIFQRTCKWAMGETLTPYEPLGLIKVSQVGSKQIQLQWNGSATKNYKVLGTRNLLGPADFSNWQIVAQDIPGSNGPVSVNLDISAGPQLAFLRVTPVP